MELICFPEKREDFGSFKNLFSVKSLYNYLLNLRHFIRLSFGSSNLN